MADSTGLQAVDAALNFVLSNNFDAKSQPCFLTCIKLIDNLIRKPTNPTFQTIKLTNPAIQSKIGDCEGGVGVLRSCGFQNDPSTNSACLVVSSSSPPSSSFLLSARGRIARRCMQDLKVPADQIPRTPVAPPPASAATTQFDAYSSHRVAVGASGQQQQQPYVSSTETQLARLERQQAQLEKKLSAKPLDRAWRATRPGERTALPTADTTTATSSSSSGDAKLVAARLQAQQQQGSTDAPLTTAAMRRVAKLNSQKVYSHTTLQILCPNGVTVTGNFRPGDTIATVGEALQTDCFDDDSTAAPFQLYVTPPRRNLAASATLLAEGLVPAAKIYIRWTTAVTGTMRESLFAAADASSFPTAHAIAPTAATTTSGKVKTSTGAKKETKEEAMLRRMMGSSNSTKRPPSNATGGRGGGSGAKPKWFKG